MSIEKIHFIDLYNKNTKDYMINSWKDIYPDAEIKIWDEENLKEENFYKIFKEKIECFPDEYDKSQLYRIFILQKYGGLFVDSDIYCIKQIPNHVFENIELILCLEDATYRQNMISNKIIYSKKDCKFLNTMIKVIEGNELKEEKIKMKAWQSIGPLLISKIYSQINDNDKKNIHILPDFFYFPIKSDGTFYTGHCNVLGVKIKDYKSFDKYIPPYCLEEPTVKLSLVIPSFNTNVKYVKECLDSIKQQFGKFIIELIWINDGSSEINSKVLEKLLEKFSNETRNVIVKYFKNSENKGISYSLNKGIKLSTSEYIFRLDSDDTMAPARMKTQYAVLASNDHIKVVSSQIGFFKENENDGKIFRVTNHETINTDDFMKNPMGWVANHQAMAYKKSAVLQVGCYDKRYRLYPDDTDITLKLLTKFKVIYNLPEIMVKFRIHPGQTRKDDDENMKKFWQAKTREMIVRTMHNS